MPEQTNEKPKFTPIVITEAAYKEHCDSYDGICLACREWTEGGVEPDARRYECDGCGAHRVYGAEEAMMRGALTITESPQ